MGGYIAWQFLRKYRDRLAGLGLCDTRAAADTTDGRAARLEMADNVATWGASRVALMMTPNLFAPATIENRPTVVAATQQVITATAPATIAAAQRGMAARRDVTHTLAAIDLPSLVLVGEHDAISRADEMESVAAAIPGALFAVIENAGHMAPVENPTAVSDAITKFLQRVAS
jgi:pimeloyl-ACP methyl ester carboxylesterase